MIYIAAQKAFSPPKPEGYRPIHVGAAKKKSIGLYRDDTGDHISKKYRNYRELTGLYWVWKDSAVPYKGFVPQGRYFGKRNLSKKMEDVYAHPELEALLQEADMVLPCPEIFKQSAREELLSGSCTEDVFEKLRLTVENLYPDYIPAFDRFFSRNQCSRANMLFCQAELFDGYCQWLFDILFSLEGIVNLRTLNRRQQPIFAVLSEMMLNVYVMHHALKCRCLPVVVSGISFKEKLTHSRRRFTNRITFALRRKT